MNMGGNQIKALRRIQVIRTYLAALLLIVGIQQAVIAQDISKTGPAAKAHETDPDNKKAEQVPWRIWMPRVEMADWAPLFTGVDEASGTINGQYHSVFYAIRVDLKAPGISIVGTRHAGSKATISETVSKFAEERGVQIAVNASFFSPCCAKTQEEKSVRGLLITDGKVISRLSAADAKRGFDAALLVTKGNKVTIGRIAPDANLPNIYTAVSGSDWLVQNGELDPDFPVPPSEDQTKRGTAPRTAVGVSKDGRFLYLAVIDGRDRAYSMGTTLRETAYVMLALGSHNALNLDGGGSSTLVEQDTTGKIVVVNRPSGKSERFDADALGIHALPLK